MSYNIDESKLSLEEKWERANFTNNFLFWKILTSNPDVCKRILEILLHIEIDHIEQPEGEDVFDVDIQSRGIRMDVYIRNSNAIFDLELQCIDTKELPKRARYYQGIMDVSNLKTGENFSTLKDSYVIFLCLNDIFGRGFPIYSFENLCKEDKTLSLNDRAFKIFFNASKYDSIENEEQKNFLKFLKEGKSTSDFTKHLENLVYIAKQNARWRQQFMTLEQELNYRYNQGLQEGKEIGLAQGERQKAIDAAKNLLKMNIGTIEQIAKVEDLTVDEVKKLAEEIK